MERVVIGKERLSKLLACVGVLALAGRLAENRRLKAVHQPLANTGKEKRPML